MLLLNCRINICNLNLDDVSVGQRTGRVLPTTIFLKSNRWQRLHNIKYDVISWKQEVTLWPLCVCLQLQCDLGGEDPPSPPSAPTSESHQQSQRTEGNHAVSPCACRFKNLLHGVDAAAQFVAHVHTWCALMHRLCLRPEYRKCLFNTSPVCCSTWSSVCSWPSGRSETS